MQALKIVGLLALAAFLAVIALVLIQVAPRVNPQPVVAINSFEECAAAGNPVMESYPRQCRTVDGRIFVEDIVNEPLQPGIGIEVNGCAVAGCSGQLCVSAEEAANIMTTCEFRAEYSCYREASCEPQADGKCGWTVTSELSQCLANPPKDEAVDDLQLEVR